MPTEWTGRVQLEYLAHNLNRSMRDVLRELHHYRGAGGLAWPSQATLADRARCCVRTVRRALHHARRLGLVDWQERRRWLGRRRVRTTNAYRFIHPKEAVRAGFRPPWWRKPRLPNLPDRAVTAEFTSFTKTQKEPRRELKPPVYGASDLRAQAAIRQTRLLGKGSAAA